MFHKQSGVCAICLRPSIRVMDIDHDHATGKVRGLLCHSCNLGIGYFHDNKETLSRAIAYLVKS